MKPMITVCLILLVISQFVAADGVTGYYRFPAIHGDTIVFTAEGDLWTVSASGGLARRITTHQGEESHPSVSPDGRTVAFSATYEGSIEVFTMPINGGLPKRQTWQEEASIVASWTPANRLLYATSYYSTLPDMQLIELDLEGGYNRVPLSQSSEGNYDEDGSWLYFVRPAFHGNVTKRYTGGTARRIWKFKQGEAEAIPLTADYVGESHTPMWWQKRVYFISDRDGTMNIWSMRSNGKRLTQHTYHSGWDVRDAALHEGRIVYQVGADLWLYDIQTERSNVISITLATDVDQWRDKWIKKPVEFLTSMNINSTGDRVVVTARGRLFVLAAKQGRLVRVSNVAGVRYRDGVFMPDGETIMALSDETGEFEFVRLPATGVGEQKVITNDGKILRFRPYPSADGKWIAYSDQNRDLWLLNLQSGSQRVISLNREGVGDIAWSPDSQWLAFQQTATNSFSQILLFNADNETVSTLTSDRVNSWSPAWDPKGDWLYFVSDRELKSLVETPWGPRQPEPYFDKSNKIYQVALRSGLRSPFKPRDELFQPVAENNSKKKGDNNGNLEGGATKNDDENKPTTLIIELKNLHQRIREVPVRPGNITGLAVNEKFLFWIEQNSGPDPKSHLMATKISHDKPARKILMRDIRFFELSGDGKKILIHSKQNLYVIDATDKAPSKPGQHLIKLDAWNFVINVREDWRQIFLDAWRMQRDYFYDPNMHGVDWLAVRDKYLPLVERVTTRLELSDLIGRVTGELSALHSGVYGGDTRRGRDFVVVAGLGARLSRDSDAGGYVVDHIYLSDPDYPHELSPLNDADLDVRQGDVISALNGIETLSVTDIGVLLRNQVGKQVRMQILRQGADPREVIVVPIKDERALRYRDWRYSRRMRVEKQGDGKIGYVHLSAMGGRNLTEWYRQYYPVFNRQGLIIDVRHNRGGNIDSLILEKLLRKAWFYWKGRVEVPYWNMQYAFRGHMVVLCDQNTASDGEAFAEGFKRLQLGQVIGTRTWGGEIWLNRQNKLSDQGIATAPMWGVYSDAGEWLVEQHGVEPDIDIDNLPHATFRGEDAQLNRAIDVLLKKIEKEPRLVPEAPPYPNRKYDYPSR